MDKYLPGPSLNAIRVFWVVARSGSMADAARELCVSQGAVSQQVRSLERQLGTLLFVRRPSGLALTDAGERFYRTVAPAVESIQAAIRETRHSSANDALVISTLSSVAARWLYPRIPQLEEHLGGTLVSVSVTNKLVDFAADRVDLAIRYGTGPWAGCDRWHLRDLDSSLVASPSLIERTGPLATATDVLGADESLLDDATHGAWREWCDSNSIDIASLSARIRAVDDLNVLIDITVAGQGFAIAPRALIEHEVDSGRLVVIEDRIITTANALWVVAPAGERRAIVDRAIAWLIDE